MEQLFNFFLTDSVFVAFRPVAGIPVKTVKSYCHTFVYTNLLLGVNHSQLHPSLPVWKMLMLGGDEGAVFGKNRQEDGDNTQIWSCISFDWAGNSEYGAEL